MGRGNRREKGNEGKGIQSERRGQRTDKAKTEKRSTEGEGLQWVGISEEWTLGKLSTEWVVQGKYN